MMALPNLSGLSLHAAAPTATNGWNQQQQSGLVRRERSGELGPNQQPNERVRQLWQDAADARARQAALERDTEEYRAWEAKRDAMLEQQRKDREEAYRVFVEAKAEAEAQSKQEAFAQLAADEKAQEERAALRSRSYEYNNDIRTKAERARTDPRVAMLRAEIEDAQKRFYTAPDDAEMERAQKDLQLAVIRANGILKGAYP